RTDVRPAGWGVVADRLSACQIGAIQRVKSSASPMVGGVGCGRQAAADAQSVRRHITANRTTTLMLHAFSVMLAVNASPYTLCGIVQKIKQYRPSGGTPWTAARDGNRR